jgi:restriction endonuclease S subunit
LCYREAEQVLLSELGLLNWKPKHKLSFIKNFSDTQTSERIDAEYFQPMYEEVIERIRQYKKGYKSLSEIVKVKGKNFQPKDDVAYRYIELANISANGNINGFVEAQGKELPTRARCKVNAGDVIVSTIEGALSSIALINGDLDNALCSTGFFIIDSEKINSETLLVLLKSLVGQLQLKKGCSGTILTAIGDDEFKRIILPDLPTSIQSDVKKKITEMYNAKALSKRLLDIAKRDVEMAIEKSEKEARKWIDSEINKIGIKIA